MTSELLASLDTTIPEWRTSEKGNAYVKHGDTLAVVMQRDGQFSFGVIAEGEKPQWSKRKFTTERMAREEAWRELKITVRKAHA